MSVYPENATNKNVYFVSEDTSIFRTNGVMIKGVGLGDTIIHVVSEDNLWYFKFTYKAYANGLMTGTKKVGHTRNDRDRKNGSTGRRKVCACGENRV